MIPSFRTLVGGVLLIVGSVILLIAAEQILTERRYAARGEHIEGVVLKKDLRPATSSSSSTYEITYRVTPRGGQPVERTESVAVGTWENLEQGSRVRVQHLPGDPASARLEGKRDVIGAAIAAGVGVVLCCVGGVLLGLAIRVKVRRRRLLKEGQPAGLHAVGGRIQGGREVRSRTPGAARVGRKGLNAMAPEKSVWTRLKKSFGFWFGGIWLVAGLPFLVAAIYLFYDDRRYETEGRIAQGTVLIKEVQRSRSSDSSSSTTSHYVTYRFTAPEGRTVEGRDQLGRSQWDALTERGPVQIAYLPSRVDSNRVLGQTHLMLIVIFGVLGGLFPLVGGAILFLSVRRAWIESRVQQAGLIVPATVTSVQPTRLEINGRPQWRLEYAFDDLRGRPLTRHVTMSPEEASEWHSGDRGIIRVDPDRPTRVVWIGKPQP